jgi:hypothetical protein
VFRVTVSSGCAELRSLAYRERLRGRRDLNGIKPRRVGASGKESNKAEEQKSRNAAAHEHVGLLALPTSEGRSIMFSPQSPLVRSKSGDTDFSCSSAQIDSGADVSLFSA